MKHPTANIMKHEITHVNNYQWHTCSMCDGTMYVTYNFITSSFADFYFHREYFWDFFDFQPNYLSLTDRELHNFHVVYKNPK